MKIIFFGTSDFAVPALAGLCLSRHKILAVVTAPDEKKGRGQKMSFSPVKDFAQERGLTVFQPRDLRERSFIRELRAQHADLFAVAAYGKILTKEVLQIPRQYAINLHCSLLPKYRGAAPVNWAIIRGERTSGVTVFKMNEFMDQGDIILQQATEILPSDTSSILSQRLACIGTETLLKSIALVEQGRLVLTEQNDTQASFAPKLQKADGRINWSMAAIDIHNRVRGLQPWPGAFTYWDNKLLKVCRSAVVSGEQSASAGDILDIDPCGGILVQTGREKLLIEELQLAGKKRMSAGSFVLGHRITRGIRLG
ncbi:MAG: methionyl-tRNA formyltransferase [Candidatus Omnitrophota bacterium]